MPRQAKPPRAPLAVLSLGAHARLYTEDHYLAAFRPFGLSTRGFRALCQALSVPMIHIGRTRLVDHLSFCIALRAVSRIGEPDFLAPGSKPLTTSNRPRRSTTRLVPSHLRKSLTLVLAELLASRSLSSIQTDRTALEAAAAKAAHRMLLAGYSSAPAALQKRLATQAHARAVRRSLLPPTSLP